MLIGRQSGPGFPVCCIWRSTLTCLACLGHVLPGGTLDSWFWVLYTWYWVDSCHFKNQIMDGFHWFNVKTSELPSNDKIFIIVLQGFLCLNNFTDSSKWECCMCEVADHRDLPALNWRGVKVCIIHGSEIILSRMSAYSEGFILIGLLYKRCLISSPE